MIKDELVTVSSGEESDHDSDNSHQDSDDNSAYGALPKDPVAVNFKKEVEKVLKHAKCKSSDFAISRELETPPILVIDIEGVGKVHFPLFEEEAKSIMERFEQSPFGKRSETVIDITVRNSKQLEPDSFKIMNPNWDNFLNEKILSTISDEMYITTSFKASLYKLLLYEPGSFFKPHRDTEKEKGMFGTLIVQLPSKYSGGDLLITHENKKKCFKFSSINSSQEFSMFFAAFYCDCQHEVLPITSGYRTCLVYNLVSTELGSIPQTPKFLELENQLLDITSHWVPSKPTKIVYALSHKYTESSLSFANLKGTDRSVAAILKFCAEKTSLQLFLALFTKQESGGAAGDEDDFEMVDPETDYSLTNLINLTDEKSEFKKLSVDYGNEVIPTDIFKNVVPDKEEFQEYSGNEGATAERWYWGAAIVFWQESQTPSILAQTNVDSKILIDSFLEAYDVYLSSPENKTVFQWLHAIINDKSHYYTHSLDTQIKRLLAFVVSLDDLNLLRQTLKKFSYLGGKFLPSMIELCVPKYGWKTTAPYIIDIFTNAYKLDDLWKTLELLELEKNNLDLDKRELLFECLQIIVTKGYRSYFRSETKENIFKLLSLVISLNKLQLLIQLLTSSNYNFLDAHFIPSLLEQCQCHGWKPLGTTIIQMFNKCEACDKAMDAFELLLTEEHVLDLDKKEVLSQCLKTVLSKQKQPLKTRNFHNEEVHTADVKLLLFKVYLSAKKLDFDMLEHAKSNPVLHAEVLLQLSAIQTFSACFVWVNSLNQVVQSLKCIISETPLVLRLSRDENWGCTCADCIKLKQFLRSTKEAENFKMGKQRRVHLQQQLKNMVDIAHETTLYGSPQTLVIKKTQTTFERKKAASEQASFLLKKLNTLVTTDSTKQSSCEISKKIKLDVK